MLTLPPQMTLLQAKQTLTSLSAAVSTTTEASVVIDAAALQQIDTSALAVLLECRRRAEALQKNFEVIHVPSRLMELARLYGVDGLLMLKS